MPRKNNILADHSRIEALRQSGLLDSPPEEPFEAITSLASSLLAVPVVLITLIDAERQFFKSAIGLPEPWRSRRDAPLSHSFCQHVVLTGAPLVVEDAREHPLVRDNLAIPDIGVVAYAGFPITTAGGHHLGSLAAIDTAPRRWTDRDVSTLEHLAVLVAHEIDQRITIRQSEERFRLIAENIPQVFWLSKATGESIYISPAFEQMWGRRIDEVQADPAVIHRDVHPDDRERTGPAFAAMAHTSVPDLEYRIVRPDGQVRWLSTSGFPVHEPSGAVRHIVGITADITERKAAEAALRTGDQRLSLALEAARQGIWDWNVETGHCYLSPEFERLLGYKPGEIRPHIDTWEENAHPEDFATSLAAMKARLTGGAAEYTIEYRLRTKEGEWRWFQDRGNVVERDDEGRPLRMVGVIQDITERITHERVEEQAVELEHALSMVQEANDALGRQKELLQTIFDNVPVMIGFFDAAGQVQLVNRAWEEVLGWKLEEMHGRDMMKEYYPDPQEHRRALAQVTAGDPSWHDYRTTTRAGELLETSWANVHLSDGTTIGIGQDITARKRAERQIRESEERYRLVSLATNEVIYDWHVDTGELFWSESLRRAFGYDPQASATMDFWEEHIHPDDYERVMRSVQRVLDGVDRSVSIEYRFRRADGNYAYTLDQANVLRDEHGQPLRIVGSVLDLTERKHAELALAESEQRYRRLFESVGEGYCVIEVLFEGERPVDYRFLEANPAFESQTGLENVVGKTARALIPGLEEHWFQTYGQVALTGEPVHVEDGSEAMQRWFDVYAFRVEKPEARKVAVRFTDISERKRAENALRESEARYRRFFEDDLTGDYISRVDGTIVECNQAFARIFGFRDVEQAKRTNSIALFQNPSAREAMLDELRRKGRLEYFETTLRRRDGKDVDVIANLVGSFDEAGELIEIKGYVFDITERNALEAQLAQSQKMETVGRLAGGIAHDFNNMLTAIIGHAQILFDAAHDVDLRDGLREIALAAERSAGLTRQLLAFSRRQVLQPRAVDLNRAITGMEGMLRRVIGEDILVTTRLSSEIGEVYVDPGQMEQVILNLVVNARDAMPRGGELTIKTAVADLDQHAAALYDTDLKVGRYAVLSITDTGHGMDEATRERIFEPFFTTKPVGQGTGLGLSTVYGIVKQSGGAIVVESDVGRGTTFVILLPLLQRSAEAQADTAIPSPPARGSETILLVEDDPSVRAVIRRALQRGGYTVVEAASGVQAIRMAEEWDGSFDLVLSDVVMPGMSGRDVVEALWKRLPGVPVLFMSGYTDDAIQQHGVLEPGTFFLQKPFTPDALRRKVREVLDGRKV